MDMRGFDQDLYVLLDSQPRLIAEKGEVVTWDVSWDFRKPKQWARWSDRSYVCEGIVRIEGSDALYYRYVSG